MVFFLRKYLLFIFAFLFSNISFAGKSSLTPYHNISRIKLSGLINKNDTASHLIKKSTKICSCQILILQTTHKRQKSFALFAERTNKKSFASDVSFANRVIEKEKRHMQSFFYDKLEVVGSVSDAIDCKSMFKRLKDKNKSLFLYDILDADIRR
jgi:hypothetical protein